MTATLETPGELLFGELPTLIGGELRGAASGLTIDTVNPATGELIARIPRCDTADVEAAVEAAEKALPQWRRTSLADRAKYLVRMAEVVEARAEELARIDSIDNGSLLVEMRKDAAAAARRLRHYAGIALQLRGETISTGHERVNYTLNDPFGIAARIIPFNHPLLFLASKFAAPVLAGNAVIMKPSEHTSLSALALAKDLAEIFPPGLVSILTGYGREVGDAIVVHPKIRRISFIGDPATGRTIQARAATVAVKSITMELGGKNPIVVFPDADLDDALDGVVRGMAFTWQGQSCGSTSRLLVPTELHGEFVDKLAARMAALTPGLPEDPEAGTGAIVNTQQMDKVLRYVDIGREDGATLVTGGTRATDGPLAAGNFVRPALFDDVDPGSRLAQTEIFGPILATFTYTDYADAIRLANNVSQGLTAAAYTRDLATAHRFARDVEAGYVWVNDSGPHFPGASFGGVKESGLGREADLDEVRSYTQHKNVNIKFG
ncbi:aldehyde dehydrogenase family protein [Pseudonocardia pini]|uniref:aldehyde dehydrogenase family protein n=1 Tax=Pseudonocardia pini TaxID=2758030 RepID=UPI0015EFE1E5|nr:aldehyde dehydrogenase family protein [Pseudonocardia pini]